MTLLRPAALKADAYPLTGDELEEAKQSNRLADKPWLKQSGYDSPELTGRSKKQRGEISPLNR